MLPLSCPGLLWPVNPRKFARFGLLVAVVAALLAGCAVNPVPTPSKTGGGQYEGKDADTSLAPADAVAGATDVTSTGADAGAVDGAGTDAGQTDAVAGE